MSKLKSIIVPVEGRKERKKETDLAEVSSSTTENSKKV